MPTHSSGPTRSSAPPTASSPTPIPPATKALLRLAKAKAMFVKHFSPQFPTGLDSLIDSSVATMERHGYKERLAEAHYFQGMIQSLFFGRQVEGMVALEKARLEVPDDNLDLQSRIYQQLGSVYELMGNLDMAINYMRRVIAIEKRRRDPMVIMVNSYNIHTLFRKKRSDRQCRLLPAPRHPRAAQVQRPAFQCLQRVVRHLLSRAPRPQTGTLLLRPRPLRTDGRLPEVQLGLAQIARLERRPAEARRHLQLAEAMADTLFSTNQNYRMAMPYFLRRLAACHHADGNTLQELRALARLDSLSTVMNRANERLVNKATLLEQDYLARLIEKQHRREVRFTVAIIVLASLIAAILASCAGSCAPTTPVSTPPPSAATSKPTRLANSRRASKRCPSSSPTRFRPANHSTRPLL
ncbi:tetratricopeptide repeat protein [Hallella seregens ATCC 51272]|uniref:Tetratricopeptide repeat protein n=1 Tax=Hallella seregens ATCC 51272 TaxID=1336250 RepID=A0ABV5ZPG8_9BACT